MFMNSIYIKILKFLGIISKIPKLLMVFYFPLQQELISPQSKHQLITIGNLVVGITDRKLTTGYFGDIWKARSLSSWDNTTEVALLIVKGKLHFHYNCHLIYHICFKSRIYCLWSIYYNLTHSCVDEGVHTFPKGINPKVNVIIWLKFKLAHSLQGCSPAL